MFSSADPQNLNGKAIVVTGGTTGIGRATARLLCAQGAKVLIFGRHEPELKEALEEIQPAGGAIHGLTADASRDEDIQRVFQEADRRIGGVDVLINNAAVSGRSVTRGDFEDWRYVLETNVLGYMACARHAIDRMRGRGGHIVNVGSMSADLRETGGDIYAATKAAIQAFSESLRKQINREGIRVTVVEPGAVATPMQGKSADEQRRKIEAMEMLEPEDIAWCIHYCLIQPTRCDVVMVQVRPLKQLI
jgi:NAD(P)-dependent dehydrogenase (short-subunit alcohol dehydrogenase family)